MDEFTHERKMELLRVNSAVREMQGRIFYCEDNAGALRRWTPPEPAKNCTSITLGKGGD